MTSKSPKPFRLTHRHYADFDLPIGGVRQLAVDLIARWVDTGLPIAEIEARMEELCAPDAGQPLDVAELMRRRAYPEAEPTAERAGEFRATLLESRASRDTARSEFTEREQPAPWKQWGQDLEPESLDQMRRACRLPISVRGAVMPDAHRGYGLPIGGVLATRNAVIPYAVGVDIACRMKLTVVDLPPSVLEDSGQRERLRNALERETQFGIGARFKRRRQHDVMDRDWSVSEVTARSKDKAWSQLGTSGSGNHFVEFGTFHVDEPHAGELGVAAGEHLALLSHSGSRGSGAAVAAHYSKLARELHPELPRELGHLAWLDLQSEAGAEYWAAMELMGHYAEANHACIHRAIHEHLGLEVLLDVENHHNFAWKESHRTNGDREDVIVHRKGATPAGRGVLGVIPGSMADPAFLVRGLGNGASLDSAAHGAGRVMSRTAAKKNLKWEEARRRLTDRRVTLLSAGLDEVPMVYKNILDVMAAQSDLVETLGRFEPRLVKMARGGRAED